MIPVLKAINQEIFQVLLLLIIHHLKNHPHLEIYNGNIIINIDFFNYLNIIIN